MKDTAMESTKILASGMYDANDKLHFGISSAILTISAVILFIIHLTGQPIVCNSIDGLSTNFVNKYCYNHDIYYISSNETDSESQRPSHLGYYHWIPLILLIQAFLFYLPHFIWVRIIQSYYLNIRDIQNKKYLMATLYEYLMVIPNLDFSQSEISYFFARKKMTIIYMIIKLWYLINLGIQCFILQKLTLFFYPDFDLFEVSDILTLTSTASLKFSSEVLCDVKLQNFSSGIKDSTTHCMLPLNNYPTFAFIILWLWFIVLAISSLFNLVSWIFTFINPSKFVATHIKSNYARDIQKATARFTNSDLDLDGILLLHFLSSQHSTLLAREITTELFNPSDSDSTREYLFA